VFDNLQISSIAEEFGRDGDSVIVTTPGFDYKPSEQVDETFKPLESGQSEV